MKTLIQGGDVVAYADGGHRLVRGGALVFDEDFRTGVIAGQRRRLQDFGDARILRDLTRMLDSLQSGPSGSPR